jgi:hypothetical protein
MKPSYIKIKNTQFLRATLFLAAALLFNISHAARPGALDTFSTPMRSRVCGLVLLSEGRSQVRAFKASQAQELAEASFSRLMRAFALLADGRAADRSAAREASAFLLGTLKSPAPGKAEAIVLCETWLASRMAQPDFDKSEEARWSWTNQAKLTFDTE